MYYSTTCDSPLGCITLASDGDSLIGLWIEGQKYFAGSIKDKLIEQPALPVFALTKDWLNSYFSGKKPSLSELPLHPIGSAFQQAVWQILCDIPYDSLTTYGEIAKRIAISYGKEHMSAQAVGGAVGHNPISIIIPCHRVVGATGSLTGYAGGIDTKIKLLKHEGVDMTALYVPKKGSAL